MKGCEEVHDGSDQQVRSEHGFFNRIIPRLPPSSSVQQSVTSVKRQRRLIDSDGIPVSCDDDGQQ